MTRLISRISIPLTFAMAFLNSACNGPINATITGSTLPPSAVGTNVAVRDNASLVCEDFTGALRFGPPDDPFTQAQSGYERIYQRGPDPIPCVRRFTSIFQAMVKFPVVENATVRGFIRDGRVTSARLRFNLNEFENTLNPETDCVMALGLLTEAWRPGRNYYYTVLGRAEIASGTSSRLLWMPSDPGETAPEMISLEFPVEVLEDWVNGSRPNYGFVLQPFVPIFAGDWTETDHCMAQIGDFRLEMALAPS